MKKSYKMVNSFLESHKLEKSQRNKENLLNNFPPEMQKVFKQLYGKDSKLVKEEKLNEKTIIGNENNKCVDES